MDRIKMVSIERTAMRMTASTARGTRSRRVRANLIRYAFGFGLLAALAMDRQPSRALDVVVISHRQRWIVRAAINATYGEIGMNKLIAAVCALVVSSACFAQAGTAVKEGAKATAETAKEAKENVQGAASGQPDKAIHKAKAKVHKAKAHKDATEAKDAAKATVK
jgi:hypothetical protein